MPKNTSLLLIAPVAISVAAIAVFQAKAEPIEIEWITIDEPGNEADYRYEGRGVGAVDYTYRIMKYEVTAGQYTAFLNAVAATDPWNLYNYDMEDPEDEYGCGIVRSGDPGNYTYTVVPGREKVPVNFVSMRDAMRFANWMHNGQPNAPVGPGVTEDGAYDLTPNPVGSPSREPGALFHLPSENEWYKAAYYEPGTGNGYWDYPTSNFNPPISEAPPGGPNSANYARPVTDLTDVGAYLEAKSPWGTFDQGGNVWELSDTKDLWSVPPDPDDPLVRGGGWWGTSSIDLSAATWIDWEDSDQEFDLGFRLAAAPQAPCPLDLDGNGSIGPGDVGVIKNSFGCDLNEPACAALDLDENGAVGPGDVGVVKNGFGPCP